MWVVGGVVREVEDSSRLAILVQLRRFNRRSDRIVTFGDGVEECVLQNEGYVCAARGPWGFVPGSGFWPLDGDAGLWCNVPCIGTVVYIKLSL